MNFLEQLAAEWYGYRGYFIRTNVKFGKRAAGGWEGEVDVLAVKPQEHELVHVEASMDALSWSKRLEVFERKFRLAGSRYAELVGFTPDNTHRIALVSFQRTFPEKVFAGAAFEIRLIPGFVAEILTSLEKKHPMQQAVPETYPLLRAIQFAAFAQRTRLT